MKKRADSNVCPLLLSAFVTSLSAHIPNNWSFRSP